MDPQQVCPYCKSQISPTFIFCPSCGVNLKEAQNSASIGKQLGVYALSIFLPPFGLIPAIKYLKQPSPKAKIVGIIALLLTIISTSFTIWLAYSTLNQVNETVKSLNL